MLSSRRSLRQRCANTGDIISIITNRVSLCNGAPVSFTVTVHWTQSKVVSRDFTYTRREEEGATREKGKSRTVFSIVNLLSINPI
uniref:Uncharacterized protein n=1 Tax=Hyaloperonospora arabidopsidis (strain Emoy2) TaxID=559515 RepID=M4B9K5_HYAAE